MPRKRKTTPAEVPELVRIRNLRSLQRPRVKSIKEVYENGRLKGVFLDTDMEEILLKRQGRMTTDALLQLESKKYKIPRNVRVFQRQGFVWNQIAHEEPWAVYVRIDGRQKRKRFNHLYDAILFHKKMTKQGHTCGIVSLCHSYELPAEWRVKKDKLPKKFKWCPHCADFRVFRKTDPPEQFYAQIKTWDPGTNRWVYPERKVWLTECTLCGHNTRNQVYRRANQPYEVRHIKQGARRVKARGDTPAIRASRKRTATRRRG